MLKRGSPFSPDPWNLSHLVLSCQQKIVASWGRQRWATETVSSSSRHLEAEESALSSHKGRLETLGAACIRTEVRVDWLGQAESREGDGWGQSFITWGAGERIGLSHRLYQIICGQFKMRQALVFLFEDTAGILLLFSSILLLTISASWQQLARVGAEEMKEDESQMCKFYHLLTAQQRGTVVRMLGNRNHLKILIKKAII